MLRRPSFRTPEIPRNLSLPGARSHKCVERRRCWSERFFADLLQTREGLSFTGLSDLSLRWHLENVFGTWKYLEDLKRRNEQSVICCGTLKHVQNMDVMRQLATYSVHRLVKHNLFIFV